MAAFIYRIGAHRVGVCGRKARASACGSLLLLLVTCVPLSSQGGEPATREKLGAVSFPNSCALVVQPEFERGIALLHSFAYAAARDAFSNVARRDPGCAMAHWGIAMTYFHQLWEPPMYPADMPAGRQQIDRALQMGPGTEREREFIAALAQVYDDANRLAYRERALRYQRSMAELAARNRQDVESQIFYALALLATGSPTDKTHANQKQAAAILEPLFRRFPQHPGVAHYLIHAYDNAELAPRGLAAARAYAKIAPSAPHALHMPSHIFTRLGMWGDSVRSNLAARSAAHQQGDIGEELHAMDYLVYAYLQMGRMAEAAQVARQLRSEPVKNTAEFKSGYAAVAIPVRIALERRHWTDAAAVIPPAQAAPEVRAIAVWARAIGMARGGRPAEAGAEIEELRRIAAQLSGAGNDYWATQVRIQTEEAAAWAAQAAHKWQDAEAGLRQAADREDAVEKLPLTPGPIIPAREQLGELLLEVHQPKAALEQFEATLAGAPGRRAALVGAARAARLAGEREKAEYFAREVRRMSLPR